MPSHRRVSQVAVVGLLALTSCKQFGPALSVLITVGSDVKARCVQLAAISSDGERRTAPMIRGDSTELVVAVFQEKHPEAVTLEARGYVNEDCSGLNEISEQLPTSYPKSGATPVTVELKSVTAAADADDDGFRTAAQGGPDCDDANPDIHPGATEVCSDSVDNDCQGGKDCDDVACEAQACGGAAGSSCAGGACTETACDDSADNDADGKRDCVDPDCMGRACGKGGTCDESQHCTGASAELCRDFFDNDGDGSVDCADTADCQSQPCEDGNFCTQGETCGAGGSCAGGAAVTCNTPPNACYATAGACAAATGRCVYPPRTNGTSCNDANLCTVLDTCNGSGTCVPGAPKACNTPGRCETGQGTCAPSTGACTYAAAPAQSNCDDGLSCTSGDKCDANRSCSGTAYTCTPPTNSCFTQFCQGDGTCGQSLVTAGTPCGTGTCAADGTCAKAFPYLPANFSPAGMVPSNAITIDCNLTVDSSGAGDMPTTWCGRPGPRGVVVSQGAGNAELYVFPISNLTVATGATLRLRGSRPIALAVFGDAVINGIIDAGAALTVNGAGGVASCTLTVSAAATAAGAGGGGAGGGFGIRGGNGGRSGDSPRNAGGLQGPVQGVATLVPLRGGCSGGFGGNAGGVNASGGAGGAGGAVQLSVAGTLTLGGRISASGGGGRGALNANGGGGGGGSGGAILLEAATLDLKTTATLTAQGGGGGQGHGGLLATGDSGADGHVADLNPAAGGQAPLNANGGVGGAGGTENDDAEDGQEGTGAGNGGGGGGGGAGRIAFHVHGSCTQPNVVGPKPFIVGGQCQ
ncbi:MAG: MopE-related protein [Myxococcaceae bacterium]